MPIYLIGNAPVKHKTNFLKLISTTHNIDDVQRGEHGRNLKNAKYTTKNDKV